MGLLEKIRRQPESTRKIIVWGITIIVAIILISFWLQAGARKIKSISEKNISQELGLPIGQEKGFPEIPQFPELPNLENMTSGDLDALIPKL